MGFDAAMRIYEETKKFPREETYSLTDQIRRSARSVCSNIAEAWRKRRYEAAFVSKLNDAESEAAVPRLRLREAPPRGAGCFAKTQTWLKFALNCNYLPSETVGELHQTYDRIIGKLVRMITNPTPWILRS